MELMTEDDAAKAATDAPPINRINPVPRQVPGLELKEDAISKKEAEEDHKKRVSVAKEALKMTLEEEDKESLDSLNDQEAASADVEAGVEDDPQLKMAKVAVDESKERSDLVPPETDDPSKLAAKTMTEITEDEKEAFIKAITSNSRYKVNVMVFNRIPVTLRSRSLGESEAIDGYVRRRVRDGAISTNVEYADLMRLCLLVSDVDSVDGVAYPEMSGELRAVKTADGFEEPEWTKLLDTWRKQPEGLANAILAEVFKFEVKYQEMVKRSADENFWKTGESTGA